MAVDAARRVHLHQLRAARVEVDDPRVLDQPVGDGVEQADLCEQTQRLRVIGDSAGQPYQTLVSLEDDDVDAGRAEKVGEHQPNRTCADDRHFALCRQAGVGDETRFHLASSRWGLNPLTLILTYSSF